MSTPQDQLLAIARTLQGRGNVSQSDVNTLFSPELAYLTGTYYQDPTVSAQEQDNMMRQYAPNLRLVLNLPDTDIRKIIANEIINFGTAPWDVKRMVEEYTAKQAELNPGVYNQEGETSDLMRFADTIFSENNKLQVEGQKVAGDDWAKVTGGLPRPEMDFSPEQIAPELFDKLNLEGQRLRTERGRVTVSDKTKKAALRFLDQQKTESAQRKAAETAKIVPHPSLTKDESVLASLQRNLANTAIGKGEAGVRGVVPLGKLIASPGAALMAVYRGLTDPLYKEAEDTLRYVAQETVGGLPSVSLGEDPIGKILYGRARQQMAGGQPVSDGSDERAENVRFGRIAQDVVRRAEDPVRQQEYAEATKKQKWMEDFTKILGVLAQQKARSVGYTPYQEALTARRNFMAGGG